MELTQWVERCPLIAILRGVKPEEVVAIGAALEREGIAIVEVPGRSTRRSRSRASHSWRGHSASGCWSALAP
jgi:2-keto-3-deoxy-6-phosphogluconate aldolase